VTLTEIAEKIDAHLKRLEADTDGFNSWIDGKTNGHRPFYFAGACRVGAYVHVCYVIYQGGRTPEWKAVEPKPKAKRGKRR
jgi:hypothetical protein